MFENAKKKSFKRLVFIFNTHKQGVITLALMSLELIKNRRDFPVVSSLKA